MSTVVSPISNLPIPPPAPRDPFQLGWRYVEEPGPDGQTVTRQVPLTEEDVLHPREGDFIVNTALHNRICAYLKMVVRWRFAGLGGIEVFCDHRIDWQAPQGWVHGPDFALFFDVKKAWDETRGTFPVKTMEARIALVMEATSPATRAHDYGAKQREYYQIGVPLYVIIDIPEPGEPGPINLFGFSAGARQYEPMPLDDKGRLWLEPVGLWLGVEGLEVYLEDAAGKRMPDYEGLSRIAEEARTRADTEAQARQSAEARVKELEAELTSLRQKPQG